jgi:hypothetical protein
MNSIFAQHKVSVLVGIALTVLIGTAILSSQQKAHAGNSARVSRVSWSSTRAVTVTDPQLQITALTLEVPKAWTFTGTVVRPTDCSSTGAAIQFTAESSDGSTAYEQLPGVQWSWTDDPGGLKTMPQGCAANDIHTAADFLVHMVVPHLRPDAKIVAVEPLPWDEQTALAQELAGIRQHNPSPTQLTLEGARIRLQYQHQSDGKTRAVEEMLSTVIRCNESSDIAAGLKPAYRQRSCFSQSTVIIRAPAGHLNELMALPQFGELTRAMKSNSEWVARVAQERQSISQSTQTASNHLPQKSMTATANRPNQ